MDLINFTTNWVKGEVLQGKIMLAIGIFILIAAIAILKSEHELLRGMLIPLGLIVLALIGYGSFQTFGRSAHLQKVEKVFNQEPEEAIKQEYTKAQKDHKTYSLLKKVWAVLIVISALLFFVFSSTYLKGLSIGLITLFLTTLLLDSTLHHRLLEYIKGLESILST